MGGPDGGDVGDGVNDGGKADSGRGGGGRRVSRLSATQAPFNDNDDDTQPAAKTVHAGLPLRADRRPPHQGVSRSQLLAAAIAEFDALRAPFVVSPHFDAPMTALQCEGGPAKTTTGTRKQED